MIKPTVGRVMWFWPDVEDRGDQPLIALVAYVHTDDLVNLAVFDENGDCLPGERRVPIVTEGSSHVADDGKYCEWMPYQLGQAARTEAAEKKAGS